MENTKIEWAHHTANIWWGCTKVHAGCDHCYAEAQDNWLYNKTKHWGPDTPRMIVNSVWNNLYKFQRLASAANEVHRVFVGSMMDIFEKPMPLVDKKNILILEMGENESRKRNTQDLRMQFFKNIADDKYPNLLFLMLTKRPSNIVKYVPPAWLSNWPVNVMTGTSVSEQKNEQLIIQLLQTPGEHFLSLEPMLSGVDLTDIPLNTFCFNALSGAYDGPVAAYDTGKLSWVIVGGESGDYKRLFLTDWARKVRDDCKEAGVPFFMKQVDKVRPIPDDLEIKELPQKLIDLIFSTL